MNIKMMIPQLTICLRNYPTTLDFLHYLLLLDHVFSQNMLQKDNKSRQLLSLSTLNSILKLLGLKLLTHNRECSNKSSVVINQAAAL